MPSSTAPLALVCPTCRPQRLNEGAAPAFLGLHPVGLACPACGEAFPIVDDTPLVMRDLDAWLASELPTVLARRDIPSAAWQRLVRPVDSPVRRSDRLLWTYANSHEGPLQGRVREVLAADPAPGVELGCGVGGHGHTGLVGLDSDWMLLAQYPGQRVLGDALDPPFPAGCCERVVSLNLLDSVADPDLLLSQMHALLQPGGRLVLASPFSWQDALTPPRQQRSPEAVLAWLEAAGYSVQVEEHDWPLQHPRFVANLRGILFLATRGADEAEDAAAD
jgi:SAM-dependent methyltransferase